MAWRRGNVPLALGEDPKLGDEGDEEEEGQVAEDDVGGRHRRQNGLRGEGGCWAKELPGTKEAARNGGGEGTLLFIPPPPNTEAGVASFEFGHLLVWPGKGITRLPMDGFRSAALFDRT